MKKLIVFVVLLGGALTYGRGMREGLQELIASVLPGATLRVPPGVYSGPIIIDKPMTLLGDGRAALDGRGQGTIVHIRAPDVTVRGFVLTNTGRSLAHEDAAILVEAPRAVIEGNDIREALFGIYLKNAPGSIIRRNTITGLNVPEAERGDAIRLWYSADVLIEENSTRDARDVIIWYSPGVVLRKNRFERGRYGIHYMYAHETLVEGNTLIGNFVGVYAMYSQKITLRRNLFLSHRGPSGYGIGLKDVDGAQIEENVIADNDVGIFVDNSPSSLGSAVLVRRNLLAYNEAAVLMLPAVRGDVFTENSFIENCEQVGIAGGGQLAGNLWAKNYWSDYLGYDADGDGVGDLPYKSERLFEHLLDRYPQMRLFLYSPSVQALEFAARALPIFKPQPKLTDPHPLMAPLLPPLSLSSFVLKRECAGGFTSWLAGSLLVVALGAIFAFTRVRVEAARPCSAAALPHSSTALIVVRHLTKRFGAVTAVENLSFTVMAGEALALWGANGAGKSTVLHCLLGLLRCEGSIELAGHDPRREGSQTRRLVGFVPQQIHLPEDFTVREVFRFFAALKRVLRAAIPSAMERLGLTDLSDKAVGALSGGMKQRVALALALLGDPPILLLDEPTASLDTQMREEFLRILLELKASGKTLIFSSHRQDEVLSIADRLLVLSSGRLVQDVPASEFLGGVLP